jgi:acyl-coenzyme A thioesterase 13
VNKTVELFRTQIGCELKHSPSPVGVWLRPVIREVSEGSITAEIFVRDEMSNPVGTMHGGIIALIADEMIGASIATLELSTIFVSVNLNTDFLYPVKKGETVTATTQIVRKGNTIIHTECRFYNFENKLIAKACGNNIRIHKS